jgi:hypothetical protein
MTAADLMRVSKHLGGANLINEMRGDLDWIVMKALEKDRTRRYATANELAVDIQRHLDNEPVLARAPSRWYRFQKLVQRNRIVFASGAAIATALLLGTIVSTRLFFEESRLRRGAELREKASHIVLLVTQRRFEKADKLLADVPLNNPSIEVAAELRQAEVRERGARPLQGLQSQ